MHQRAGLAGGCFGGMQDLIRKLPGVVSTRSAIWRRKPCIVQITMSGRLT